MGHTPTQEIVDIYELPEVDRKFRARSDYQVTAGDLHANSAKLFFIGCKHGYFESNAEDYKQFVELYKKESLTKEDIDAFKAIISRIKVNPDAKAALLRLIGDILADRGQNDYFTLKLLELLVDNGIPLEILISNHDAEFIRCLESGLPFNKIGLENSQGKSCAQMQALIEKGLITREEVIALYRKVVAPNLKALSYSFNDKQDKLTIYSHAPIGLKNIEYMAKKVGVPYLGDSPVLIAKTIDAINQQFAQYVAQGRVTELLDVHNVPHDAINGKIPIDPEKFPFAHLIWNRMTSLLDRPSHIYFVHGHDMTEAVSKNIFNLDNLLGKMKTLHSGIYNVLFSKEVLKVNENLPQQAETVKQDLKKLRKSQNGIDNMAHGVRAKEVLTQDELVEKIATIIAQKQVVINHQQPSYLQNFYTSFYSAYLREPYAQFVCVKQVIGNLFRSAPRQTV